MCLKNACSGKGFILPELLETFDAVALEADEIIAEDPMLVDELTGKGGVVSNVLDWLVVPEAMTQNTLVELDTFTVEY